MKKPIVLPLAFFLILSCCNGIESKVSKTQGIDHIVDTSSNLLAANTKGLEILKRAISSHGDISDPTLVLSISVKNENGIHRGQSLVSDPPYETYLLENRFNIDRINGEEISHTMNNFAGFNFESFAVVKSGKGRRYDLMTYTYDEVSSSSFNHFRYFPHTYLIDALASAKAVFFEGVNKLEEEELYTVAVGGSTVSRLYFSVESGLLRHVQTLRNYPPYGDGVSFRTFSNFEKMGSLMLPQSVYTGGTYGAWGESGNEFVLEVIADSEKQTILNDIDKFTKTDYSGVKKNHLKQLEESIYLIENISGSESGNDYNILFVEFDEFILVGEAPVNNKISIEAIRHINSVTNKPIRYLMQSHHHNDHWGGIREYIAAGATVITTAGNQALLERIASAPFALDPDSQWKAPKPLSLQLVDKHFEINDVLNAVKVYDIGPTNHANEMLIAYFPKHGILWQADLIKYGFWSLEDPRTTHLIRKIRELDLEVKMIIGVHGGILKGKALEYLLNS